MARLILTQAGEDVAVGGDVFLFGTTAGGEVVTVLRGIVALDPSFNFGGDTVRLPDDAAFFTIRLVGASAIIAGLDLSVTIPVGTAGLQVAFNDVTRTLRFDPATSTVKLGDQVLTGSLALVFPAGGAPTLTGTEQADTITGTAADDVIDGLGGADIINGGSGNDVLRGGAGGDDIDGSFGNDRLYGGPGADRLYDNEGASALIDGGTGNDWISIDNKAGTSFTLSGGDGDDFIEVVVGSAGTCEIDAGAGQDRLVLDTDGVAIAITLGSGRDQLVLADTALASPRFGPIAVTDFQAGQFGDTIEFLTALSVSALNWDQGQNPFAAGYLRLVDRDGSAVLQFDRDGAQSTLHGYRDVFILEGISATALTSANLEGFAPPASSAAQGQEVAIDMASQHAMLSLAPPWQFA